MLRSLNTLLRPNSLHYRAMSTTITKGVSFDTLAREWRFKWSPEDDKLSLAKGQELLDSVLGDLKALDGVKEVQRVVCGGCLDFKVVTSFEAEKFEINQPALTALEEKFLEGAKGINGVTQVETQTYTLMKM